MGRTSDFCKWQTTSLSRKASWNVATARCRHQLPAFITEKRSRAVQHLIKEAGFKDVAAALLQASRVGQLRDENFSHAQAKAFRALAAYEGWQIPRRMTLKPANCPALLLHWKVATAILKGMGKEAAERFAQGGKPQKSASRVRGLNGSVGDIRHKVTHSLGSTNREGMEEPEHNSQSREQSDSPEHDPPRLNWAEESAHLSEDGILEFSEEKEGMVDMDSADEDAILL